MTTTQGSGLAAMEGQLSKIIGQHVRLVNETDVEGLPLVNVRIHAHGTLEGPDDGGEYYVRIGKDLRGHGCNGIGFTAGNVSDVFRQSSGIWEITLRG